MVVGADRDLRLANGQLRRVRIVQTGRQAGVEDTFIGIWPERRARADAAPHQLPSY